MGQPRQPRVLDQQMLTEHDQNQQGADPGQDRAVIADDPAEGLGAPEHPGEWCICDEQEGNQ